MWSVSFEQQAGLFANELQLVKGCLMSELKVAIPMIILVYVNNKTVCGSVSPICVILNDRQPFKIAVFQI
jgi:hypothetical protein